MCFAHIFQIKMYTIKAMIDQLSQQLHKLDKIIQTNFDTDRGSYGKRELVTLI